MSDLAELRAAAEELATYEDGAAVGDDEAEELLEAILAEIHRIRGGDSA